MNLGQKINNLLEYKININLNAELSKKKAVWIVGSVTVVLFVLGFLVGETMFWGGDTRGVFERKIEVLEKVSKKTDNPQSKIDLALAYYLNDETEQAQGLFEEILRQEANNAAANIYYGLILADRQKYREALPYIEKGIEKEPQREKLAYIYMGISYYQLGKFDQALRALDTGLKLDPGSAVGHYYLGLVYKKRGDNKSAGAALNKALILSGDNYPAAAKALQELPVK